MTREEALLLIKSKIKNENLVKHLLATEAIMQALAKKFGENEEKWALAGLLHDIDWEETKDDFEKHGIIAAKILKEKGLSEEICNAVKAHNHKLNLPRETKLEKALYAVDPITGLIVACALVQPDKKLASVSTESVLKKFKEKSFAAGADREAIKSIEELDISLEDFIKLSLKAMQSISKDLGL